MDNKKITFHTNIKKTASQQPIETMWCVFASDYNSVQVEFVVSDLRPDEIRTVNPTIVLIMEDGSTVQRTKEQIVQKNNVFSYKLKDREGQHIGVVKAQLKLETVTGETYQSNIYTFTILESLDSVPVPKEFVIDDIQNILQEVKHHITHVFKDEIERERVFKEYVSNIQLSEKQRETWFNQSQQTRASLFQVFMDEAQEVLKDAQQVKDLFDELTETGIIETNIREKLGELETSYAPRLSTLEQNDVSLTAQLQQTNEQFNQAVGAITEDSEVILARNNNVTLGSRLDSIEDSKKDKRDKYYQVNGSGDFSVYFPLSEEEYAGYRFVRDTVEDYMKMYEQSVDTLSGGDFERVYTKNYEDVTAGSIVGNSSDLGTVLTNQYANEVGTILTTSFTGHSVTVRLYKRYDGGMWSIRIDGQDYGTVSVWNNSLGSGETFDHFITDTLANKDHVIELEFLGEDSINPPTTSSGVPTTARGWVKFDVGTGTEHATFLIEELVSNSYQLNRKFDFTVGFSNKEFAFEISDTNDLETRQWFPAHSGIGTTNIINGMQEFIVDGNLVDIETESGLIPFEKGYFSQRFGSKLSTEDTNRSESILVYDFSENDKVYQKFEMKFLKSSVIRNGYVFQMPMTGGYLSRIKTNKRELKLANTTDINTNEFYSNLDVNEFIASSNYSNTKDYFMRVVMENSSQPLNSLYLQRRSETLQKLYPKVFSQESVNPGKKIWFDGYWQVGKIKNANVIHS